MGVELRDLVDAALHAHIGDHLEDDEPSPAWLAAVLLAEQYHGQLADVVLEALGISDGEDPGPGPVFRMRGVEREIGRRGEGPHAG